MDEVRLGLIGCGGISRIHARAALELPQEVRIIATCDVRDESARERMHQVGAEHAATDYRRVLDRPDIDAVDICLPHNLHAEVAIAAAQAGKHILCEKPIATTTVEAERMIDAADHAGVRLMVAYCERYASPYQAMRRLLEEGAIGEPFLLRIDHTQWFSCPPGHWINDPAQVGGGTVACSGTHRLDLLRWFGGEVARVASRLAHTGLSPLAGEDTAVVSLEFTSGAVGEMICTWSARRSPWFEGFLVYGRQGTMHSLGGVQVSRNGEEFERVALPHDDAGGFREEMRHFAACVRDGTTPLTDGVEALRTLRLVEAVYAASRGDRWVVVEE